MDKIACTGCGKEVDENGYCEKDGSPFGDCCWSEHIETCDACKAQLDSTIKLPCFGIIVNLTGDGGGSISSDLHEDPDEKSDYDGQCKVDAYNTAIDGLESLILACACSGIDIESSAFLEAIESAVQGIANNY